MFKKDFDNNKCVKCGYVIKLGTITYTRITDNGFETTILSHGHVFRSNRFEPANSAH